VARYQTRNLFVIIALKPLIFQRLANENLPHTTQKKTLFFPLHKTLEKLRSNTVVLKWIFNLDFNENEFEFELGGKTKLKINDDRLALYLFSTLLRSPNQRLVSTAQPNIFSTLTNITTIFYRITTKCGEAYQRYAATQITKFIKKINRKKKL
jgi:hypothetical protein